MCVIDFFLKYANVMVFPIMPFLAIHFASLLSRSLNLLGDLSVSEMIDEVFFERVCSTIEFFRLY